MNTNKKWLYSWKTQNRQLRVNLEANSLALALLHSSCDDPPTAEDSLVPSHSIRHFGINWDYTLAFATTAVTYNAHCLML